MKQLTVEHEKTPCTERKAGSIAINPVAIETNVSVCVYSPDDDSVDFFTTTCLYYRCPTEEAVEWAQVNYLVMDLPRFLQKVFYYSIDISDGVVMLIISVDTQFYRRGDDGVTCKTNTTPFR